MMSKGLFVLGTGTDIGKTYVTGLLLKYLRDNGFNASFEMRAGFVSENDKSVEIIFWVFHRVWPFLGWKLLERVW